MRDDDRLIEIAGIYIPKIRDIVSVHQCLASLALPFRCGTSRAIGIGKGGSLGKPLPQRMGDQGIEIKLSDWLNRLPEISKSLAPDIRSLAINADGFAIGCSATPSTNLETTYPASAGITIIDDAEALGTENYNLAEIARSAIQLMDADGNCAHALVDYGYAGGYLNYGTMYGAFPTSPMTWQMWVDFADWGTLGEAQATHVRRVVWGNYFGPRMAERLGKGFIDDYLSLTYHCEGSPQTAERLPSGGIYATLTGRPQDQIECEDLPDVFELPIVRNAVWLRQRLRSLDMLLI